MSLARPSLVGLLILVAGVAIVLVLRAPGRTSERGDARSHSVESPRDRAAPAAEPDSAPRPGDAASPARSAGEPAREPAAAESTAVPEGGPVLEVEVLEAGMSRAVPGAGVWLWPGDEADPLELGPLIESEAPFRADAGGRALIPVPAGAQVVAARSAGLAGVARLEGADPASPVRVELHPDFDVSVEVRHASGAPAQDVLVAFGLSSAPRWEAAERATDAAGRLTFVHVGLAMALARESTGQVWVARPLDEALAEALDARRPPSAPLVFVLPPCATVDLRVRGPDGAPAAEGTRLELAHLPPGMERDLSPFSSEEREYLEATTVSGVARFPCVELGGEIEVVAHADSRGELARAYFSAPQRAGALEEHALTLGDAQTTLVFRVLDELGVVLADQPLALRFLHRSGWSIGDDEKEDRSDAQGRVRFALLEPFLEGDRRELTVEARERSIGAVADLARVFPAGAVDLGDLRLAPAPLLAAGRALAGDGAGVQAGISLHYPVLDEDGDTVRYWREYQREFASSADGSFELRGFLGAPRLRLQASRESLRSPMVAVDTGQRGVDLHLQPSGRIGGRVLTTEGAPTSLITLALTASGAERNTPERRSTALEPDRTFLFGDLPPGKYDLSVDVRGRGGIARVEGLFAPPGEACADPRLTIDLRSSLHWMRFELVSPEPLDDLQGTLHYSPFGRETERVSHLWFDHSPVDLFSPYERIDLVLDVPGFRPVRLTGVSAGQEIVLLPALTARLRLPPHVTLPTPPLFVKATLVVEGEEDVIDFGGAAFDERREITCRAPGPGRLVVRWIGEKRGTSSSSAATLESIPAQYVELVEGAGEPVILLEVEAAALRTALANAGL